MSRSLAGSSSGSFLQVDKAAKSGPPFTVSLWFRTSQPTRAAVGYLFWMGSKASTQDWWAISFAGGLAKIEGRASSGTVFATATTSNSIAGNVAQHVCGVFASSTSRKIILNGNVAGSATSTTSCLPSAPDRTALGRASDSTPTGGVLADIGHVAIYSRALTADEQGQLASGANPQTIADLIEYWPITGSANPEVGVLGTDLRLAVTGAPSSTFSPPVQPYTPPPPSGSGDAVVKAWTSELLKKKPLSRVPPLTFDETVTVPAGTLSRKVILRLTTVPENNGTTITSVLFGGLPMTYIGSNGWAGNLTAALITAWELVDPPTGACAIVVTASGNLWTASAVVTAIDDYGSPIVVAGDATASELNYAEETIATEPGSLVLFAAAIQGADGSPGVMTWTGGVLDAQGASPGASLTTDHAAVYGSKIVASGTSETPRASFATSDGRGWLVLSIPPGSSAPPPADGIAARVSVGDTNYEAAITGTTARVQTMHVEFDRVANTITIDLDQGTPVTVPWTGTENPTSGDLVLGAALLAGVVQPGGDLKQLAMLVGTAELTPAQQAMAQRYIEQESLAPVVMPLSVELEAGVATPIDLSPSVQDPSGWGWQITTFDPPEVGSLIIADDHRLLMDLSNVTPGQVSVRAQVATKHPSGASTPIDIAVRIGGLAFAPLNLSMSQDTSGFFEVLSGLNDPDGGFLFVESVSDAENGTAVKQGDNVSYTPTVGYLGSEVLIVTVRSTSGRTGLLVVNITVHEPGEGLLAPVASFVASPTVGSAPLTVELTDTSINEPTSWEWMTGGLVFATTQNARFTFQANGLKHITLTVGNDAGTSTITRTNVVEVREDAGTIPGGFINVATGVLGTDLMPVIWSHMPTLGDAAAYAAASENGAAARDTWMEAYIRSRWKGRGTVGLFYDYRKNTLANYRLNRFADGTTPAYQCFNRRRRALGDADGKQWRASMIGEPFPSSKPNKGFKEAAITFRMWVPTDYTSFLNDPALNPEGIKAMWKFFWLFWGGPFNGENPDDVSPAAGQQATRSQRDWSVRMQCNGDKKGDIFFKGYMYTFDRVDQFDAKGNYVDSPGLDTIYSPRFNKGAWNEVKAYLKIGKKAPMYAKSDGIIRLWLNGNMFYERKTVNVAGENDWLIQGCGPIFYAGGDTKKEYILTQKDQSIWFTDLKMAGRN